MGPSPPVEKLVDKPAVKPVPVVKPKLNGDGVNGNGVNVKRS